MRRSPSGGIRTNAAARYHGRRPIAAVVSLLLFGCGAWAATSIRHGAAPTPFPALFQEPAVFAAAIAHAEAAPVRALRLSGITVPHHLLAADLIAAAFRIVEGQHFDGVVVLFPDHFKKTTLPFATTHRDFETVFGRLQVIHPDVSLLLKETNLVEESDLFGRDHGIGAILPFIKHYLPSARILPIAVSVRSRREDWDRLATRLKSVVGPTTLIVQSTDFSHFLPQDVAVQRDQEVLNVLAAGKLDAVSRLRQPQHMDSRGSQYLQLLLQQHLHASPVVLFNSNSQAFAGERITETTSYIVQLYEPRREPKIGSNERGSKVYCFAGNTFLGRGVLRAIATPSISVRIKNEIKATLNGCPLIVDLQGVLVPEIPTNLDGVTLAMPAQLTLDWLRALNVVAVSLANNHAMDLGSEAFEETARMLSEAGFTVLRHGSVVDLGAFRLATLTDLDNHTGRSSEVVGGDDIQRLARTAARPPLFAFVNWGSNDDPIPGEREVKLINALHTAAVSLIVGARPHQAAGGLEIHGGGQTLSVYSLGDFLFDKTSRVASGNVLEVRVFEQGTFFARLVPIPNYYESAARQGISD